MLDQVSVSIALLCYNHEQFLPRTLESFRAQTDKDFELILVDNCSADKSFEIMEQFMNNHPEMNIKLKKNDSCRVCDGRRAGFEMATKTYIMFHDGDDWVEKDIIEKYKKNAIENHYPDCVIGSTKSVDDSGRIRSASIIAKKSSLWMKNTLQAFMIKREIIEISGCPFFDTFFEDFYVCMCIKANIKSVSYIYEPLYNYYCNPNSASLNEKTKVVGYWSERMEHLFSSLYHIVKKIDDEPGKTLSEYQFIKHYYSCVFAGCNSLTYRGKIISYKQLKKIMEKYFPQYLSNTNIKLFTENYDGGTFKKNIWLASRIEKIDNIFRCNIGMSLLLGVYHLCLKLNLYKIKH